MSDKIFLKIFLERDKLKLVSDERDIMVERSLYNDVVNWCKENNILAVSALGSTASTFVAAKFGVNLWRIKDANDRAFFILRWGK
jgi:hypothetical protein